MWPDDRHTDTQALAEATKAHALGRSSEARHNAAAANARQDVVTCNGCKAYNQGGDWGQEYMSRLANTPLP